MIIPRENKMVRIYCQLSEVKAGTDGRFDRSKVSPGRILKAAQGILSPYKLEYSFCDWWTSYQVRSDDFLFRDVHSSYLGRLVKESGPNSRPTTGYFLRVTQFTRIPQKPGRA